MADEFPSKYLKAADIKRTRVEEISHIELAVMPGGEKKPVLYLKGMSKGVILNVTNRSVLIEAYGDNTGNWIGKEVELFTMMVTYNGATNPAIRLRIPEAPEFNDNIPA